MQPHSLKVIATPDGIVVRRFWVSGEDAYRCNTAGAWHHCLDHKGPWIVVQQADVPLHVLDAIAA